MTTLMLALPLSNPIRGPVKKRRVLLVDTSPSKRELRAETMRKLGMDVDCAADISEARSWWRADLYNLVLINMENEQGHRDKFCDDMRSATPLQQLAFLVGKPEYLADSPNTNGASSVQNDGGIPPQDEMRAAPSADISRHPPLAQWQCGTDRRPHAMLKHGTPSPPQPNLRFCLNCRKRKCNEESLCW